MWGSIIRGLKKAVSFFQPKLKARGEEELPERIRNKAVYILGTPENPWALAFACPCGCGSLVQLNLLQEARPRWHFSITRSGGITIKPSIWRKEGCRSHFFIRKGRIIWV